MAKIPKIESFDFDAGEQIGWKYEVIDLLGSGWEGEVYRIREIATGIERAGKFFFPHRNVHNRAFKYHAKKLNLLRHCSVLIQYHTQETIYIDGHPIAFLVSELVEGLILSDFLKTQPGKRLHPFQALHLLHAMACGLEPIHLMKQYHGDLHTGNFIVHRYGLEFDLKLLDFFHHGKSTGAHLLDDVCNMLFIFYESMGGEKFYRNLPPEFKKICCGLKRTLIEKKYKNASLLRTHLENMSFELE